jgi:Tol biopolymer transport system component
MGNAAGGRHALLTRAASVLFAATCLVLAFDSTARAAFPGANGKIAFSNGDIYTVNADGSGTAQLTSTPSLEFAPEWSPDGQQILFSASQKVWRMNADGSGAYALAPTTPGDTVASGAWSPDGAQVAFVAGGYYLPSGDLQLDIYKMNLDGSGLTKVTSTPTCNTLGALSWSPKGDKIVFQRSPVSGCGGDEESPSDYDIYTVTVDGTVETNLTATAPTLHEVNPSWSPDGSKIAYESSPTFGSPADIYVMNADGTAQTDITTSSAFENTPAWSSDGSKIAFVRTASSGSPSELWTMQPNGSGQSFLSALPNSSFAYYPDWQPLPPAPSPAPSYEAPRFAPPITASLVPVFRQCGTGSNPVNGSHAPPLSVGACLPGGPQSNLARFGPQANGGVRLSTLYGDGNAGNGDQADLAIGLALDDVQTPAALDYNPNPNPLGADLTLITRLRVTDRSNGVSGTSAGTTTDLDFSVPVRCAATADTTLGADCKVETSADSVTPGAIKENNAAVLQVFRARLNDSGANGIAGDADDRLFATEGVYIP